jgi:hypothetical protein
MVVFGNVKPTGTLVEIRLCMKGSVDKFLETFCFSRGITVVIASKDRGQVGPEPRAAAHGESVGSPAIINAIELGKDAAGSTIA